MKIKKAADYGLTAEDFGPTAIASCGLIEDCGPITDRGLTTTSAVVRLISQFVVSPQSAIGPQFGVAVGSQSSIARFCYGFSPVRSDR